MTTEFIQVCVCVCVCVCACICACVSVQMYIYNTIIIYEHLLLVVVVVMVGGRLGRGGGKRCVNTIIKHHYPLEGWDILSRPHRKFKILSLHWCTPLLTTN